MFFSYLILGLFTTNGFVLPLAHFNLSRLFFVRHMFWCCQIENKMFMDFLYFFYLCAILVKKFKMAAILKFQILPS
jgi:hypothetical protein